MEDILVSVLSNTKPRLTCAACGHQWSTRQSVVRLCQRCKTPRWYIGPRRQAPHSSGFFEQGGSAMASREPRKPSWMANTDLTIFLQTHDLKCHDCDATTHLWIDHIIPRAHGGTSELPNLQWLCEDCNRHKGVH